eukprot:UN13623
MSSTAGRFISQFNPVYPVIENCSRFDLTITCRTVSSLINIISPFVPFIQGCVQWWHFFVLLFIHKPWTLPAVILLGLITMLLYGFKDWLLGNAKKKVNIVEDYSKGKLQNDT